jgi:hypothetical protein
MIRMQTIILVHKRQQGSAILEFILLTPLILLVCFVLVEFGVAFINQTVLTRAASAAALAVSQCSEQPEEITNAVLQGLVPWFDQQAIRCGALIDCPAFNTLEPGDTLTLSYSNFDFQWIPAFSDATNLNGLTAGMPIQDHPCWHD